MRSLLCSFLFLVSIAHAEEALIETRVLPINYLDEVTVNFPAHVVIKQGNKNEYYIKGDSDSVKELKISAQGGNLAFEKKELQVGPTNIKNITIYITAKNLVKLNTAGALSIDLKNITGDKLSLNVKGKSNLRGDFVLKDLYANLSGDSIVSFRGRAQSQEMESKGMINYDASKLISNEVDLRVEGKGKVSVQATQELSVVIAGPITVFYSGNPIQVKKNVTGSGLLRKL